MIEEKKLITRVSSEFAQFILLAIAIMLAAPMASYADTLPAASVTLTTAAGESGGIFGTTSGSFTSSGSFVNNIGEISSSSASGDYFGSTSSTVSVSGSAYYAIANLTFYYEVVQTASAPYVSVPVDFLSFLSASANTSPEDISYAEATVYLNDAGYVGAVCAGSAALTACTTNSNPASDSVFYQDMEYPGEVIEVSLYANCGSQLGECSAMIDPEFYIDPSFQYASDFTLEVSTAESSMPEPGSIWLVLVGSALLALGRVGILRKHRKGL
jgi:hypothetical protein